MKAHSSGQEWRESVGSSTICCCGSWARAYLPPPKSLGLVQGLVGRGNVIIRVGLWSQTGV